MAQPNKRSFLWKLTHFSPKELFMLVEALVLIGASAVAIRLLPFSTITKMASIPISNPLERNSERRRYLAETIGWAVDRAAKRSRLRALCFERGLTAQIMLRRRGVDSTLFYGVAPGQNKPLDAHVWVMDQNIDVTGAEIAEQYALLVTCPAGRTAP